ncbi:bifunctional 3,4-dihydroxy-2-butanone-4-phosphate synthase/GTP cyclohydrolase II, partial [Candidatus Aerophobetes bacterium]
MAIVVDDKDRENEGDLIIPASCCTPEAINLRAKYARGLICVAITSKTARELGLSPMVESNTSLKGPP